MRKRTGSRRPNLIFLLTDQQRWDALGCQNGIVKTPNLDALARRGIRFDQAVCQVPMCAPSRYSMLLGLYGSQLGLRHNTAEVSRDRDLPVPTLMHRLRDLGYQTAGFGKTHWHVGKDIARWMNVPPMGNPESTRGFEVRAVARGAGGEDSEPGATVMGLDHPEGWARLQRETRAFGGGGEGAAGYEGVTSALPAWLHKESWLTDQALKFLDRKRDRRRPMFLYLSFDDPHPGFNPPGMYEDLYDINDIPERPLPPWNPRRVGSWRHKEAWLKKSSRERRLTTLRYYALCSFVDDLFGRVLRGLEERGELKNSFIMMTSDHGEMLGDRMHRFSKYCLYEGSVRVPMIIAGKGVPASKRGTVDHRPVELTDVMPTLLDVAGAEIPPFLPGGSLLRPPCRAGSFAEMHGSGYESRQRAPMYMWRSRNWKLLLTVPGDAGSAMPRTGQVKGQLYDLKKDPHEWRNLYSHPRYLAKREELTRQLLMHLAVAWAKYPQQSSIPVLHTLKRGVPKAIHGVDRITNPTGDVSDPDGG